MIESRGPQGGSNGGVLNFGGGGGSGRGGEGGRGSLRGAGGVTRGLGGMERYRGMRRPRRTHVGARILRQARPISLRGTGWARGVPLEGRGSLILPGLISRQAEGAPAPVYRQLAGIETRALAAEKRQRQGLPRRPGLPQRRKRRHAFARREPSQPCPRPSAVGSLVQTGRRRFPPGRIHRARPDGARTGELTARRHRRQLHPGRKHANADALGRARTSSRERKGRHPLAQRKPSRPASCRPLTSIGHR